MNSAMQAVVSVKAITVYGDSTTNGVPLDYLPGAVKNAANAANLKARSDFHIEWLTEIIAACSPGLQKRNSQHSEIFGCDNVTEFAFLTKTVSRPSVLKIETSQSLNRHVTLWSQDSDFGFEI